MRAMAGGLTPWAAGGGRDGGARGSSSAWRAAWRALKMTQSNKRMHATRDTSDFMICGTCGRARDARRYVADLRGGSE